MPIRILVVLTGTGEYEEEGLAERGPALPAVQREGEEEEMAG